jgi:hypothetical protein
MARHIEARGILRGVPTSIIQPRGARVTVPDGILLVLSAVTVNLDEVKVSRGGTAYVEMTLTSPACPVAGALPGEVETAICGVAGVRVKLVFTPPWTQDRVTEEARLDLGLL